MTQLPDKTELGLAPRIIAAGWFGLAACIPIVFFFVVFAQADSGFVRVDSRGWVFANLPVSLAAFFGFTIGSRILDFTRRKSASRILMRGIAVSVCSYLGLVATNIILAGLFSDNRSGAVQSVKLAILWTFIIYGVGAIYVGWLIVMAGGVAGLLLYTVSQYEILRRVVTNAERVCRKTVYLWTAIAAFILIAANILITVLARYGRS